MKKLILLVFLTLSSSQLFADETDVKVHTNYDQYFINVKEYYIKNYNLGNFATPVDEPTLNWSKIINDILKNRWLELPGDWDKNKKRGLTLFFPAGEYHVRNSIRLLNSSSTGLSGGPAYHSLKILGAPRSTPYAEGDLGGTFFICDEDLNGTPLFLVNMNNDGSTTYEGHSVKFKNINFRASSTDNNICAIKGFDPRESEIINCYFDGIDTAINFQSQGYTNLFGKPSYSDGIIISNVNILDAEVGIVLSQADYSKISSIEFHSRGGTTGRGLFGIMLLGGCGIFLDNILINGLGNSNGAAIYLKHCHSVKLNGIHCESNYGDIYALRNGCTGISIEGSIASFSYKRLLWAENAKNCELKDHKSYSMIRDYSGTSNIDCDIYLDNSQVSISNLIGNSKIHLNKDDPDAEPIYDEHEYSFKFFTSSSNPSAGLVANYFQNNSYTDYNLPFLLLRDDNKEHFKVDKIGNLNTNENISSATIELLGNNSNIPKLLLKENDLENTAGSLGADNDAGYFTLNKNGNATVYLSGNPIYNSYINSGKVGIGKTNPSEKLDVDGNIKASGSITSSSIQTGNINSTGIINSDAIQTNDINSYGNIEATGTVNSSSIHTNNVNLTGDIYINGDKVIGSRQDAIDDVNSGLPIEQNIRINKILEVLRNHGLIER